MELGTITTNSLTLLFFFLVSFVSLSPSTRPSRWFSLVRNETMMACWWCCILYQARIKLKEKKKIPKGEELGLLTHSNAVCECTVTRSMYLFPHLASLFSLSSHYSHFVHLSLAPCIGYNTSTPSSFLFLPILQRQEKRARASTKWWKDTWSTERKERLEYWFKDGLFWKDITWIVMWTKRIHLEINFLLIWVMVMLFLARMCLLFFLFFHPPTLSLRSVSFIFLSYHRPLYYIVIHYIHHVKLSPLWRVEFVWTIPRYYYYYFVNVYHHTQDHSPSRISISLPTSLSPILYSYSFVHTLLNTV